MLSPLALLDLENNEVRAVDTETLTASIESQVVQFTKLS